MEHNKRVVQDFLHAVGRGDAGTVASLMAPGATWEVVAATPGGHLVPGLQTREQFLDIVKGLRSLFTEGITYQIHTVLAEADTVVVEASCDGPVAGLNYHNRYVFLVQMVDGRVGHGREYMDFAYLSAFQAELSERTSSTA